MSLISLSRKVLKHERAASLVEYVLLIALVALIAIPAVGLLGERVTSNLNEAGQHLTAGEAINCGDPPLAPC